MGYPLPPNLAINGIRYGLFYYVRRSTSASRLCSPRNCGHNRSRRSAAFASWLRRVPTTTTDTAAVRKKFSCFRRNFRTRYRIGFYAY